MRSKQNDEMARMVDGYDSTVTVAEGLGAMHLVWIVIGLALAALGTNAVNLAAAEPSNLLRGVRAGAGLVFVMTLVVWIFWAVRSWSNLAHIGRQARLTLGAIVPRYVALFALAVVAGLVSLGTEQFRQPARTVAVVALVGSSAAFPVIARYLLRTFWVAGAGVGQPSGSPPVFLKIWVFASWKMFWLLVMTGMAGFDGRQVGMASIIAGVVAIAFGASGFRLMPMISERFDERLLGMINDVGGVDPNATVTSQEIESAWAESEAMVNFNTH